MGCEKGIPNNYRFIFRTSNQIYGKASFPRLLCKYNNLHEYNIFKEVSAQRMLKTENFNLWIFK